jgi:hypothetical protein
MERHVSHTVVVGGVVLDQLVSARVPEFQGMVSTTGSDSTAVQMECDLVDNTTEAGKDELQRKGKGRTLCGRNSCANIAEFRHSKASQFYRLLQRERAQSPD